MHTRKFSRAFMLALAGMSQLTMAGCATHAENIQASEVSPMQYEDYSCRQIRAEIMRVGQRVNTISGVQDREADGDAWATGIGAVLFWPALFFIKSNDHHVELAQLKGEYEALHQEAIHKNCDVVREIDAMEKTRAKKAAAQETEKRIND